MSTIAEIPGQAAPPVTPPSMSGDGTEKTVTPPESTTAAPDTLAPDLDADEQAAQKEHGSDWAIKAYRKEKKESAKYKDIREVADRIGNPELVKAGLQAIDALGDPTVPIGEAQAELLAFDEDRYHELRNNFYGEFVDRYPDQVLSDVLGRQITVKDAKAALDGKGEKPKSTKTAGFKMPEDLKLDYPEVAELLEGLLAKEPTEEPWQAAAAKEAETKKADDGKVNELQQQLDALKTEKQRQAYLTEVQAEGTQLYDDVFSDVDEGLKELGLAPDKDDPEDLASLKEAARDYLGDRKRIEAQFDSSEENVKLANRITEHLARRQYGRAKSYLPAAKIAARAALEQLAEDRKGKALVEAVKRELQALAKSGQIKGPGGKGPLMGGTATTVQPPSLPRGKGDDALWDSIEERVRANQNAR